MAVLVRTRSGLGGGEEGGAVGLLVDLFRMYNDEELTGEAPLCHIGERTVGGSSPGERQPSA